MTVDATKVAEVYTITRATAGETYPITFPYIHKNYVKCYVANTNTKEQTDLVLGVDYTVNDEAHELTLLKAQQVGFKLAIYRVTELTQEIDWEDGQAVHTPDIEQADDKLTHIVQELAEQVDRSVKIKKEDAAAGVNPEYKWEEIEEAVNTALKCKEDACSCASAAEATLEQALIAIPEAKENAIEEINNVSSKQLERIEAVGDLQAQRLPNIEDIILSTHGKSYQEVTFKLLAPVVKDEVYTLPADLTYIVGRNQVRIHYDGVFLSKTFWEEVGELDAVSNQIKFLTSFDAQQELNVWIGSLDNTEENAERAETAAQAAENAVAAAQAKIDSAAAGLRSEVQEEVDRAVQAAETAETAAGRVNEIKTAVNTAVETANTANGTASTALATATTAETTANGVDFKASSAIIKAEQALSAASAVESKADNAIVIANAAEAKANSALANTGKVYSTYVENLTSENPEGVPVGGLIVYKTFTPQGV